jgi:UPF0042 nucleotide-binding protein
MDGLTDALGELRGCGARTRILFLDASEEAVVRWFEATGRRHPLAEGDRVLEGIAKERELLEELKGHADVVVDTSDLNVHQLRDRLHELFADATHEGALQPNIVSFGYKHGLPLDVDLLFDCRFLPNPHWVEELRPLTGREEPVRRYVLDQPETEPFLEELGRLLDLLLPAFVREGKSYLTIGIGCTGGHHRSVVIAEELAKRLRTEGYPVRVTHRDVNRG